MTQIKYTWFLVSLANILFTLAREEAIDLGKELLRRRFIHHVVYEHDFKDEYLFYRFLEDVKTRSLNAGLTHHCLPRKGKTITVGVFESTFIVVVANEIADDLRKLINEIYDEHLSPDGFVSFFSNLFDSSTLDVIF